MKSYNSNTAVVWENELQALKNALTSFNLKGYEVWPNHNGFRSKTTFLLRDDEGNSITGSWNYDRLNHFILGYGKAFEKANNPQPKEPTHITWWKGLNEEEQTKLCQKHFQGIPVESLMDKSILAMYQYENAVQPVISEVMKTHNLTMLAAMEFGYRECEKGNNLDMAFINFNKALNNK